MTMSNAARKPSPVAQLKPKTANIIPIKVGVFGSQGSGKTTSTALLALALSVLYHNRAPVYVTDTEPGWQFLKRIFQIEGVELIQRTTPTFAAMLKNIREAQAAGACVYAVDSLTVMWQELMQSFKVRNNGRIPINVWGDIKALWGEYSTTFLNSPMHCFALGRLGNVMEEIDDDRNPGDTKLVKTGEQFKAGGGESFGYEPHLLLQLSLERKAKVKAGSRREGEGRMIHRVDVLKDRSWILNGGVFRWSDKPKYEKGGFAATWNSIKPHFELAQETGVAVQIEEGDSSTSLIAESGHSDYYERKERRDIMAAEISASLDMLWSGTAVAAKTMRVKAIERVFGFKTKEALERANLTTVERGLRIVQAFELLCKRNPDILQAEPDQIMATLDKTILAVEAGTAEEPELAF